jgi:TetR/AcrR family transcriptional regulator, lmrAB and yxaGH operons repressor
MIAAEASVTRAASEAHVAIVPNDRYSRLVAPRIVSEEDVLAGLTELFRGCGYEAATLTEIAHATGLQKSSLYHRFPGGKQQMAAEVAAGVAERFASDILAPLRSGGAPSERVRAVGRKLTEFYGNGHRACLLDALSFGEPGSAASDALRAAANAWTDAFASLSRDAGHRPAEARMMAQDAIASLEGALVVTRVTGDNRCFRRAIERLPILLGLPPD